MRKYEPAWLAIKTKGTATLAAPPETHRRIVLAVRKEKTYDAAWKYYCLETGKRYKLLDKSEDSMLTFTLVEVDVFSYANLTIHDL